MRLIDADAIKYEPLPKWERNYRTYNLDDAYEDGYNDAMVDVRNSPTIEERKTGRWIFNQYDGNPRIGNWHCSECGQITIMPHHVCNFCPNCGAKMDEEESDED